jgi:tRNA A-37 threonylcarbamoyl transferase component Bud32
MGTSAQTPRNEVKFKSKRNQVTLIEREGQPFILKRFNDLRALSIEQSLCPTVEVGEDYLIKEYVEGELLLDALEAANPVQAEQLAGLLAGYLDRFHNKNPHTILSDLNFRNFIVNARGITCIDFDQATAGEPLQDHAAAIAFLELYDTIPEGTKSAFRTTFTALSGFSMEKEIQTHIEFLKSRRK